MESQLNDSNFPMDGEGRTYHVSVKRGEVANRILTVGDSTRLLRLVKYLDPLPKPFHLVSHRGYTVVTGRYKTTPVSLIAIGMGCAMIDFLVREVRAVVEGDLVFIRFGSCGSLDRSMKCGSIGVPEQIMNISTNYDHIPGDSTTSGFHTSNPINSDPALHQTLLRSLNTTVASSTCEVHNIKLHASADTFYSSQGRIDPSFEDDNEDLIEGLLRDHPDLKSLEMESGHLFHLASIAKPCPASKRGTIKASAAHMVFAGRTVIAGESSFISPETVAQIEPIVGKACLDALVEFEISDLHTALNSVWQ